MDMIRSWWTMCRPSMFGTFLQWDVIKSMFWYQRKLFNVITTSLIKIVELLDFHHLQGFTVYITCWWNPTSICPMTSSNTFLEFEIIQRRSLGKASQSTQSYPWQLIRKQNSYDEIKLFLPNFQLLCQTFR